MENIKKEAYILEPLRLYLLKNSEKYKIYLDTKKPSDKNFIKYEFEENEYDNFLELVLLTEEFDSNILKLKDNCEKKGLNIWIQHINSHKKEPIDKESLEWKLWFGNNKVDKMINDIIR